MEVGRIMNDTVLVVDDDQLLLRLLEINLNKVGCQVYKATDGPTALRLACEEMPSLILLDLMMPRMDGWEVIRQLKDSEATRDIPVIIVTGKVDAGTRSKILEMGADDFVSKPFDVIELREMIRNRLSVHN
jgi:DNA-binding response OmpR family regulator